MKNPTTKNMLEKMDKKHPYRVPDHYFEDFQARMEKLKKPSEQKYIPQNQWARIRPYVAMAASFLLLVTAGTYILEWATPGNNHGLNQELDEQELYAYYCDIIPRTNPDAIFYVEQEDELSSEDILAYLDASDIDLETIYEYFENEE